MSVQLSSIPISNQCGVAIQFENGGAVVDTLDAGEVGTLSITFDCIRMVLRGTRSYNQNPNTAVTIPPGYTGFIAPNGAVLHLCYLLPGNPTVHTITFT